jgi:hypothetical protein
MKRLGIYRAGLLLGLFNLSMSAEAGTLAPKSRGVVAISITIAPHFVMSEAPRSTRMAVGNPAEPLCIASASSAPYSAILVGQVNGRSEAFDLPLLRNSQLPADQQNCPQELGTGTAVYVDSRVLRAFRESNEPVTLLIVPD